MGIRQQQLGRAEAEGAEEGAGDVPRLGAYGSITGSVGRGSMVSHVLYDRGRIQTSLSR